MTTLALLLVIASGFTHSIWNLFAKRSINKDVFLWMINIPCFFLLMPVVVKWLMNNTIPLKGYVLILLSVVLQSSYFRLLSKAYQYGDISQVYPIMRGTGALLVPVLSVLLFNEELSVYGWIGLGFIIIGLIKIGGFKLNRAMLQDKKYATGMMFALGVGLCITGYTLADKLILDYISPLALLGLCNIGYMGVLTGPALRSKGIKTEWKVNKIPLMVGALFSPGSYLLFLYAMSLGPLSHLSPIREIGTVFGTLLGIFILKEQQGKMRIVMSIAITTGIILIGTLG
ncbi:EamA family transporter [Paenibacillus faecalis]|uniref:EamA family transporter n=1 Tax=Paenibacillus faecalis TaxID=2079532 RepID=UPI000D0F9D2F|nr:DMT family transporter [Paenibacillus faecalis]